MPRGLTAIVCDDAPGFRALLATLLRDEGLEVVAEGATWTEAEQLAAGVDAVVVDLWMPELDVEALARVRACAPDATLAVVTALGVEEARQRVAGVDVDMVLPKATPPRDIASAIASCARDRRAAAQL
jgi:DNA-binding NarL/FixJ family response regulator